MIFKSAATLLCTLKDLMEQSLLPPYILLGMYAFKMAQKEFIKLIDCFLHSASTYSGMEYLDIFKITFEMYPELLGKNYIQGQLSIHCVAYAEVRHHKTNVLFVNLLAIGGNTNIGIHFNMFYALASLVYFSNGVGISFGISTTLI